MTSAGALAFLCVVIIWLMFLLYVKNKKIKKSVPNTITEEDDNNGG